MDGEGLMGAVSSVVDAVGDVVGGAVDVVKDVGSAIDDAVNDVVPGGWVTVGAAALGAGALGALEGAGTAAAAEGGLASLPSSVLPASEAFATGSELATAFAPTELASALATPSIDLGTQALGDITTGAVGSTATPSAIGSFNPANISGIGIQAPELSTLGSLGGTAAMGAGTAGLTAEQLANANLAGSIGSNASSGLGYLGGAESLPSGTAGITGVTSTPSWTDISKSLGNLMGGQNSTGLATALYGKDVNIGNVNMPTSKQPAFGYTQQQPIQSATPSSASFLGQLGDMQTQQKLANLLKG